MAKILLRKMLNGSLGATDADAVELLKKWKAGDELWVEVRKARNPKHHRLYFALLHLVYENQEKYTNFEHFRKAVQIEAGHVDELITLTGEIVFFPRSVDYSSLDEFAFTKVFTETMRVCIDRFLKGIDESELRAEVERHAA